MTEMTSGDGPPRSRPAAVRWLERAELTAGAALLVLILALMLTQAFQRHLPVAGWVWTGELARFGLVWLTFSLVGYLLGRDEHITLQLIDFVPQVWIRRTVWIFANLVVTAVCLAFTAEAVELVFGGSPQSSPALGIPMTWVYAIPMVGLALAALRGAINALLTPPPRAAGAPADDDTGEDDR